MEARRKDARCLRAPRPRGPTSQGSGKEGNGQVQRSRTTLTRKVLDLVLSVRLAQDGLARWLLSVLLVSLLLVIMTIVAATARVSGRIDLSWPQHLVGVAEIRSNDAAGASYDVHAWARSVVLSGGGDPLRAIVALDRVECEALARHITGSCASGFRAAALSFSLSQPTEVDLFGAPLGQTRMTFATDGSRLNSLSLCHWSPPTAPRLVGAPLTVGPFVAGRMTVPDGTVFDLAKADAVAAAGEVAITVNSVPSAECSPYQMYVYPPPETLRLGGITSVPGATIETRSFDFQAPDTLLTQETGQLVLGTGDVLSVETDVDQFVGVETNEQGVPEARGLSALTAQRVEVNGTDVRPTLDERLPWVIPLLTMGLGVLLGAAATWLITPILPPRARRKD